MLAELFVVIAGVALVAGAAWAGWRAGYKVGQSDGWIECFVAVRRARERDYIDRWIERIGRVVEVPRG